MARYLIVKVEDDSTRHSRHDSTFAQVRKALHAFPGVSDFGLSGAAPVTASERKMVVELFETVMGRAREAQKAVEAERALTPEGYRWLLTTISWNDDPLKHLVVRRGVATLCGGVANDTWLLIRTAQGERCPECLALAKALL